MIHGREHHGHAPISPGTEVPMLPTGPVLLALIRPPIMMVNRPSAATVRSHLWPPCTCRLSFPKYSQKG